MRDRDFKKQKRRVERIVDKWLNPLGLTWWDITFHWKRGRGCKLNERGSPYRCFMHCSAEWEYRHADIFIHLGAVIDESDYKVEKAVIHEFGHILVSQMRPPIAPNDEVHDEWRKHEELVVTALADAFLWVRQDAERAAKKKRKRKGKRR